MKTRTEKTEMDHPRRMNDTLDGFRWKTAEMISIKNGSRMEGPNGDNIISPELAM